MSQPKVSNRARLLCLMGIFFILIVLLIGVLAYRMLIQGEELQAKALDQWTRMSTIEAARGDITDTNGNVLASSSACYSVVLMPRQLSEAQKQENKLAAREERIPVDLEALLVQSLSDILQIERETISTRLVNKNRYEYWLKRQITDEQARAIQELLDPERSPRVYGVKLAEDILTNTANCTETFARMGDVLGTVV